jgi:hypothetical protein
MQLEIVYFEAMRKGLAGSFSSPSFFRGSDEVRVSRSYLITTFFFNLEPKMISVLIKCKRSI